MAIMELVEIGEVIGRNVAKLMNERGWTQGQLARSGLSQAQISDLVNGKTKEPKLSKLLALAGALGVSLERLYEGWLGPIPPVSETEAQHLEARLGRPEKNVSDLRRDLKQPPYDAGPDLEAALVRGTRRQQGTQGPAELVQGDGL